MNNIDLDRTDFRILELLQRDASLSAAQVGERVGVTPPTAWRRIKRLEGSGVIIGRYTALDPKKVGFQLTVFVTVKLINGGRETLMSFARAIQKLPEVLECYTVTGSANYLLRVVVSDTVAYEAFFMDRLSAVPGILSTESAIALTTVKATNVLPLPLTLRRP